MTNLFSATVSLEPGDLLMAADELRSLERRLLNLGAIDPDVILDERTRCVHLRFAVEADELRIRTLIDAVLVELARPRAWAVSGVAYYSNESSCPDAPRALDRISRPRLASILRVGRWVSGARHVR